MTLTIEQLIERLDKISDLPRTIKIDEARKRWGMSSKNTVIYTLEKLEELGYVRHVPNGKSGQWEFIE